jgi:hypothetical protein
MKCKETNECIDSASCALMHECAMTGPRLTERVQVGSTVYEKGTLASLALDAVKRATPTPLADAAAIAEREAYVSELERIAHELRTYNPAADEYKGKHIHKVWARKLDAVVEKTRAQIEAYASFLDDTKNVVNPYARHALMACIADCQSLSYSEDRGITVSEAESIGGVLHELRRLQNLEAEAVEIVTRESARAALATTEAAAVNALLSSDLEDRFDEWHPAQQFDGPSEKHAAWAGFRFAVELLSDNELGHHPTNEPLSEAAAEPVAWPVPLSIETNYEVGQTVELIFESDEDAETFSRLYSEHMGDAAPSPKLDVDALTDEERAFVELVRSRPGLKLNGGESCSTTGDPLWIRPEAKGLIEAVGSYKWRPLSKSSVDASGEKK